MLTSLTIDAHEAAPAFAHSSGPKDAKIAFVAEAFGEQEDMVGKPLIGAAGQEFSRLLEEANIPRKDCFLTNTFAFRPPDNRIPALCTPKGETGADYPMTPISMGNYLRPIFFPEIERLREELSVVRPNLVVALGAVALWALTGKSAIGTLRGTVMDGTLVPFKILPTYHPSYLFKVWSHRPIVVADLMKAAREARYPEIRRPQRTVLVHPTIEDVRRAVHRILELAPPPIISVDIETYRGAITMIGFGTTPRMAIVIDLFTPPNKSFWPPEVEVEVRGLVNSILASDIPKVTQNGLYDIQYLLREGFSLRGFRHDTMLLHHAIHPEMNKGLGFLGSIYTNEPAWKVMRGKGEEFKRDE
jgi:DNA polymerase